MAKAYRPHTCLLGSLHLFIPSHATLLAQIIKGQHKGLMGQVVEATDSHVKVELHSKLKKVFIARNQVALRQTETVEHQAETLRDWGALEIVTAALRQALLLAHVFSGSWFTMWVLSHVAKVSRPPVGSFAANQVL